MRFRIQGGGWDEWGFQTWDFGKGVFRCRVCVRLLLIKGSGTESALL